MDPFAVGAALHLPTRLGHITRGHTEQGKMGSGLE